MFSRGQSADHVQQIGTRQLLRLFNRLSGNQLGQHRSAHQRRRATVSKIPCRFDSVVFDDQREPQSITAHWIGLFSDGAGVRQFTGVARAREMVFEYGRVRQKSVFIRVISG